MKLIVAIFLIILVIACSKNFNYVYIDNGKKLVRVSVEIADDPEEQIRGLMFREHLDENAGMFFIFDDDSYQSFWMINTLIPLDMIFIDSNLTIVDIHYAIPCRAQSCMSYKSRLPSQYVLELNGNFTAKNDVKIGDRVTINRRNKV